MAIGSKWTREAVITRSASKSELEGMTHGKERRLKEKLELRDFKLNALLQVTQAINSESSESELMSQYVGALKENLGIDRLVLYASDLDGQRWSLLVSEGTDSAWPASRPSSFFKSLDLDGIGLAGALDADQQHPDGRGG